MHLQSPGAMLQEYGDVLLFISFRSNVYSPRATVRQVLPPCAISIDGGTH